MEFIGFLVVLLIGGALAGTVLDALSDPAIIEKIATYSPWIASNADIAAYISAGVLVVVTVMIPFRMMTNRHAGETNELQWIGSSVVVGVTVISVVLSIGYLLSLGWVAATSG